MKKLLFVSLAAALTLASCSSDDKQNAPVNPGVTEGYIAFNISGVGNNGSRAHEDDTYEDGTGKESQVEKINLYFFDAYGRQTRVGAKLPEEATFSKVVEPDANGDSSIEDQYKTVAILLTKDEENANANGTVEVLAVVNQNVLFDKSLTKAQVLGQLSHNETYEGSELKGEKAFSMTSSVYRNGITEYNCTPISLNNVFTTETEAKANPVDIYVEREMAKVEVINAKADVDLGTDNKIYSFNTTAAEIENGKGQTESEENLHVEILGMGVTYIPTTSHYFKQYSGEWFDNNNLVSATNHRSFWADPVYTAANIRENYLTVNNYTWAEGNKVEKSNDGKYLNLCYNGQTAIADDGKAHVYVTENTTAAFSHIMLLGEIRNDANQPVKMVRWAGKNYKTEAFKTQYVNMLKYAGFWKKTGDTYATLDADDLEWYKGEDHQNLVKAGTIKAYENTCYVKTGVTVVKKNAQGGFADSNKEAVDEELLKENYIVWFYESGKNYYYLPIKSGFAAAEAGAAENGIVRNHVYRVNVTKIKGLGTPVADPAEVIIPENPKDKAFYMAATINVLQWRVVAEDYEFTTN